MTQTIDRARLVVHTEPRPKPPWEGFGLIVLGLGAALVAVLGPLVTGIIRYHASPGAIDQVAGGDAAALVMVAPVAIVAGILVLRHRPSGYVLALGPAAYGVYTYAQLALGADVIRYEGNSEQFFGVFLGLFVLAGFLGISAWSRLKVVPLPGPSARTMRIVAWVLIVAAAFLTLGLHLPGLLDVWSGSPQPEEYLADPTVFWLVKLMDLGIVVPGMVAVALGVLRRSAWARTALYAAVGWMALLGAAVAGMAIVMQVESDPGASLSNTIAFSAFALFGLVMAVVLYRPVFRRPPRHALDRSTEQPDPA